MNTKCIVTTVYFDDEKTGRHVGATCERDE